MEIKVLVTILLSTILINNFVFSQMLGICPFLGVSNRMDSAVRLGLAVLFVIVVASFVTYAVYNYLLVPFHVEFISTIAFILIIVALAQFVEIILKRISPVLYSAMEVYLPMVTANCMVLGVAVINARANLIAINNGLLKATMQGFGAGIGFILALVLMAGIRERLELAKIPENVKGLPITFLTAGILALAFQGFSGMKI